MPMQLVVMAVELLLLILLAVGVVKLGRGILSQSGRFLPGGGVERLGVLIIALATVLYMVSDTTFSDAHLGIFVFIAGIGIVFAYAND